MAKNIVPKVSVLMPVYNCEKYLRQALDSILAQTFKDFELIIINDGSSDSTVEILKEYSDKRIRLINNPKNLGLIKTLNIGLKIARAKYVARMDADDISFPERLQVEYDYLKKNKHVVVIGSWSQIIDSKGNNLKIHKNPTEYQGMKYELMFGNTMTHPSIMMKKHIIIKEGGYSDLFNHTEDFNLYSRLIHKHVLKNLGRPLIYYRQHEESVTWTNSSQEILRENTYKIMRQNISYYTPITDHEHWLITKVLTVRHPDSNLRLKDVIDAYLLHRRIYKAFKNKEELDSNDISVVRHLYKGHNKLMITKYLIGKYKKCFFKK